VESTKEVTKHPRNGKAGFPFGVTAHLLIETLKNIKKYLNIEGYHEN